jgi:hypothetical protein
VLTTVPGPTKLGERIGGVQVSTGPTVILPRSDGAAAKGGSKGIHAFHAALIFFGVLFGVVLIAVCVAQVRRRLYPPAPGSPTPPGLVPVSRPSAASALHEDSNAPPGIRRSTSSTSSAASAGGAAPAGVRQSVSKAKTQAPAAKPKASAAQPKAQAGGGNY